MLSYGCWCQIRNQEAQGIVPGHGTPVDELDAACKRWHQCRACITIDFGTEGTCDPNYVGYDVGFDPVTQRIDCQFNTDECQFNNCGCDEQMVFTLTEQFTSGLFNNQFVTLNDGSGFDHVGQCHAAIPHFDNADGSNGNGGDGTEDQTNQGGNGGNGGNNSDDNGGLAMEELQCCGTYPNRFEFLTHGGSRSCCGEVTYDTNKHDCCNGGFLGAIGSCPAR